MIKYIFLCFSKIQVSRKNNISVGCINLMKKKKWIFCKVINASLVTFQLSISWRVVKYVILVALVLLYDDGLLASCHHHAPADLSIEQNRRSDYYYCQHNDQRLWFRCEEKLYSKIFAITSRKKKTRNRQNGS